jgi:hypothetical protein
MFDQRRSIMFEWRWSIMFEWRWSIMFERRWLINQLKYDRPITTCSRIKTRRSIVFDWRVFADPELYDSLL